MAGAAGDGRDPAREGRVVHSGEPDSSSVVVGRERELIAVSTFLEAVPAGPAALVIEGEAGIGKTTLWQEGLGAARARGYRALVCRAIRSEAQLAFTGLGDLLDRALDETLSALPDPQRRAIEVALLRADAAGTPVDQRAVSVGVLGILRALAGGGALILAIDDLQAMDPPSTAVLEFVVRRLEHEPVGIMTTVRASERSTDPLGLTRIFPNGRLRRIEVGPLSPEPIDQVLRSRLGTTLPLPTMQQLHRTSGGNPLFALEIGRAVLRRGVGPLPEYTVPIPDTLRDLIRERLSALRAHIGRTLLVISALSNPTVAQVAAALGSLERTAASLAEAVDGGVIEVEGERLRFTHPLLSSVVYSDAPPERRRQIHRRLAQVVSDPEERARHLALAAEAPDREVAAALDDAAKLARLRGAPDAAAQLAEMASRLTPPELADEALRRTTAAAEYHFEAGDMARAHTLLDEVVAAAPPGHTRAEALRRLGNIRYYDDSRAAVDVFLRALDDGGEDPSLHVAVSRDLAWMFMMQGDLASASIQARTALDRSDDVNDDELRAQALTAVSFTRFLAGRQDCMEPLERAVELGGWSPGMRLFPHPNLMFGVMLKWMCEYEASRMKFEEMRKYSVESGEESPLAFLLYHMSELECWTGNMAIAEEYATQSCDLAVQTGQQATLPVSLYSLALVHAHRGRLDEAKARAEEGLALAESTSGAWFRILQNLGVLGFVELSAGNPAGAWSHYRRIGELSFAAGLVELGLVRWHPDAVECLLALGETDEARRVLDDLDQRAENLHHPWGLATAARCRGLLLGAGGDLEGALDTLRSAVDLHRGLPQPFELGRTLLALGTTERRARQTREARVSLQRAVRIFGTLENPVWAERAQAQLSRIGGRAPQPGALTPTEERVAELVMMGRTNREVARELFISLKTVEVNLTRIYAKLGVRSRTELAAQARERNLPSDARS
jgi:DNA-binding CsgD family transcriptional regulator